MSEARSLLSTLLGEIGLRNATVQENDAYVYGDMLSRSLKIPIGHDFTPVNWLRRTAEIHGIQFMGRGFTVISTYDTETLPTTNNNAAQDPNDDANKQRIIIENEKRKDYAEKRRQVIDAIMRDNQGDELFARAAENASAVGDSVIKAWFDKDKGKYNLKAVEAIEHCYALWKGDDFREFDAFAYVYQLSKDEAKRQFEVDDDVATSPLGFPLAVLSSANTITYISTQPMVTVMEITGIIQGWGTDGNGNMKEVPIGKENKVNVTIVGQHLYKVIDDEALMPYYYILPNKRVRRRAWGMPDITKAAININLTYIETLSDWRTLASKVNFPKFKYFGFTQGSQLPTPKPRTVEGIPLVEGQDIKPLDQGGAGQVGERDFMNQLTELQSQFVREVGISRVLFDDPDFKTDSNQVAITALKSIGDVVERKRQLWEPIIQKIFMDALECLSKHDDSIKDLFTDDNWHLRISWPSMLNKDDPVYQTMLLNRFNATTISIQSYLEAQGETKEELDRIREEMEDPMTAAIHGKIVGQMASYKLIPFGTQLPPKTTINLRGDLTPNQEGNIATQHNFNNGPFPPTIGPQGNQGLNATDNTVNTASGTIKNAKPGATAVQLGPNGQPVAPMQAQGQQSPSIQGTPANNTPGGQPMSQPGSGAAPVTGQGALNQANQQKGG